MIKEEIMDEIFADDEFREKYLEKVRKLILTDFEKNIDLDSFYQKINEELECRGEDIAESICDDIDLSGVQKAIEKRMENAFTIKKKVSGSGIGW